MSRRVVWLLIVGGASILVTNVTIAKVSQPRCGFLALFPFVSWCQLVSAGVSVIVHTRRTDGPGQTGTEATGLTAEAKFADFRNDHEEAGAYI